VPLNELKALLALGTLLTGALGGLAPLFWARPSSQQGGSRRLVGAGNAFAAGLFLGIGLLHFLPEGSASYASLGVLYPVASVLALGAFLLLLLLEHVLLPDAAHDAAHAHSGEGHSSHHHHPPASHDSATGRQSTSAYILLLALSIHSVLAGTVLGADNDAMGVLMTFLAIAVHKGAAGLALGLALATNASVTRVRAFKLVSLFALMTPLGILVGSLAGAALRSDARLFFDATAAALAAGTFLYIGAFDLVQDEFLRAGRRWTKWVCAVVGAALAAFLAGWL